MVTGNCELAIGVRHEAPSESEQQEDHVLMAQVIVQGPI
jgi:hypothetical protein